MALYPAAAKPHDRAPRAAQLALKRLHLLAGKPEMLLEKPS